MVASPSASHIASRQAFSLLQSMAVFLRTTSATGICSAFCAASSQNASKLLAYLYLPRAGLSPISFAMDDSCICTATTILAWNLPRFLVIPILYFRSLHDVDRGFGT